MTFSKHSAVISAFGKEFIKTGAIPEKFHRYLLRGQEDRLYGDYMLEAEITKAEAQRIIEAAEEFIRFTEDFLKDG